MQGRRTFAATAAILAQLGTALPAAAPGDSAGAGPDRARLDHWYRDLFATGPAEARWDRHGADLYGIAGREGWLLLVDSIGRRQLLLPGAAERAYMIPRDWRRIGGWRTGQILGEPIVQIQPLDRRFMLVARAGTRTRGGARCAHGGAALDLYERTDGPAEFTREEAGAIARYLFERSSAVTLCVRYDAIGHGDYAVRNFDPGGRPFTTLDGAGERARIVTPGPVEMLLGLDEDIAEIRM